MVVAQCVSSTGHDLRSPGRPAARRCLGAANGGRRPIGRRWLLRPPRWFPRRRDMGSVHPQFVARFALAENGEEKCKKKLRGPRRADEEWAAYIVIWPSARSCYCVAAILFLEKVVFQNLATVRKQARRRVASVADS